MICIYAEVEVPDISFVESIVTSHEKVSKCAVLKYDDGYLVALTLKPIFTRSERRETLSYLKTILELYDINSIISADLDVYNSALKIKEGKADLSEVINRVKTREGVRN